MSPAEAMVAAATAFVLLMLVFMAHNEGYRKGLAEGKSGGRGDEG